MKLFYFLLILISCDLIAQHEDGIGLRLERHFVKESDSRLLDSNYLELNSKVKFHSSLLEGEEILLNGFLVPVIIGVNSGTSSDGSGRLNEVDFFEVSALKYVLKDAFVDYPVQMMFSGSLLTHTHEKIGGFTGDRRLGINRVHLAKIESNLSIGKGYKLGFYAKLNVKFGKLFSDLRSHYDNNLEQIKEECPQCDLRENDGLASNIVSSSQFGVRFFDFITFYIGGVINGATIGGLSYYGDDDPTDLDKRNELNYYSYRDVYGFVIDTKSFSKKGTKKYGKIEIIGEISDNVDRLSYANGLTSRYDYSNESIKYLKTFVDQEYTLYKIGVKWILPSNKK